MIENMNIIQKQQQRELEKIDICMEILRNARNELYLSMRFFDVVLNRLEFMPNIEIQGVGTDGFYLYFYPDYIVSLYKNNPVIINRAYLHIIFHCLFQHMQATQQEHAQKLYNIEETHWNLACDIVAESMIDDLGKPCVRKHNTPYRKTIYQKLKESLEVFTPKGVYRALLQMQLTDAELAKMQMEFWVDDHSLWNQEVPPEKQVERERIWKELNEKLQTEMETFSKEASQDAKSLMEQVQIANSERYDYRKFLKKFAILKEEMQVDTDSFDYIFYNYGMSLYGNMPLIEPQETKEVLKVEDFVIAIDTSMSCKEELIKKFLEETYSILSKSENFFRKINIHIIQCDDKVQSDVVITNYEELQDYMKHFQIKGYGGTDFRPVFGYVNQLLKQKAFKRLKGLIYFTDGYGTFPAKRPLYETAFVFMKEDYRDIDVPVWAMKLIIEPEELMQNRRTIDEY